MTLFDRYIARTPEQIERDRLKERRRHLKRFYGITLEEFEALFISQGSCCACCKTTNPGKRGWHVDHNHITKKIRGILCNMCNVAIGVNGDTLESVEKAFQLQIAYLGKSQ